MEPEEFKSFLKEFVDRRLSGEASNDIVKDGVQKYGKLTFRQLEITIFNDWVSLYYPGLIRGIKFGGTESFELLKHMLDAWLARAEFNKQVFDKLNLKMSSDLTTLH